MIKFTNRKQAVDAIKTIDRGQSLARNQTLISVLKTDMEKYGTDKPIEIIYAIKHGLKRKPKCVCGKELPFLTWNNGYQPYCCRECYATDEGQKERRKETTLKRYGVSNISKCTRDKANRTVELRYGTDMRGIQSLDEIITKKRKTCEERYGVSHHMKADYYREAARSRSKAYWSDEKWKNEIGIIVTMAAAEESVREKARQTCLKNNGVEYGFHTDDSVAKSYESRKKNGFKRNYKLKEVKYRNRVWQVQGYEPFAIHWFINQGIKPSNIIDSTARGKPVVTFEKGNKAYVPDLLVYKGNDRQKPWLVEVKSTYTLGASDKRIFMANLAKFRECKRQGLRLLLLVFDSNGNLILKSSKPHKLTFDVVSSI